jgi:uncharacterized membrane protein
MGFLNPWLLFGTAAVAVPIIIHLLNRFRHRQVEWGAMELLRRALVIRSRQVKLEDLILLLLRCLAVLLLALAVSRPTLTAANLGNQNDTAMCIVVDCSYSMAHAGGINSRFDRAIQQVRQIVGRAAPGQEVCLVTMGNRPRVWGPRGYDAGLFDKELKKLAVLGEGLNLENCLALDKNSVLAVFRNLPAASRECYIITDGQAISWQRPSEAARKAMAQIAREGRIYVLPVADDDVENLAITSFEVGGGTLRKGGLVRFNVQVHNFGRQPAKAVVNLLADNAPIDQKVIEDIKPGGSAGVPLYMRMERAGTLRLAAQLGPDGLLTDNVRYLAATVRDQVKVLCVDGRPSALPYQSATSYLLTALLPKRGKDTVVAKNISWMDLPAQRLDEYDVVILADVPDVREEAALKLKSYVQRGGGLIVFTGNNINVRLFNERLTVDGATFMPAELIEAVKLDAKDPGKPMEIALTDHPIGQTLSALPRELLDDARFQGYFRMKLSPGGRAILNVAGEGTPLLAERTVGRGKVLLFASSADRTWSNFIIHPAGPMVVHEAISYLTTPQHERPMLVGSPLVMALPEGSGQPGGAGSPMPSGAPETPASTGSTASAGGQQFVTFRLPSGQTQTVSVVRRGGVDSVPAATLDSMDAPGFYEGLSPTGPTIVAAANVETSESDIACMPAQTLSAALPGVALRVITPEESIATVVTQDRVGMELWKYLLALGLVVMVVEGFLARMFSRRMMVAESTSDRARERDELLDEKVA